MIRTLRVSTLLAASLILAACETGQSAYEAPLRNSGVLDEQTNSASTSGNSQPSNIAAVTNSAQDPNAIVYSDDGSFSYSGSQYRITDLSAGERPPLSSDEAGLWMSMDRFERQLRSSGKLVRDQELLAYIREVTCKVAEDHCGSIRVFVVDNPVFNASMAPNGLMMVHTGLLLRMRNEAELAAVLSHEIGHFLRRHSYQRMQDIVDKTNFMVFFQIALAAGGVPVVGEITQLAVLGSIAAYSRDHEREADGYSLLLLHRVGYDPRQAANIWGRITRETEAAAEGKDTNNGIFFASHPTSSERHQVLDNLASQLAQKMTETEVGRDQFQEIIRPRRAQWLRQETHLRQFNQSTALFDMLLEDGNNPAEIYYFKGELHRLRNDEGDNADALKLYQRAVDAEGSAPAEIYRSMGLLHRQNGSVKQAAGAFEKYLERNPGAEDRQFIENLITKLKNS